MNSRFFHINRCFQYVLITTLVKVFLLLPSFTYAKPDLSLTAEKVKSKTLVRDFINYREFIYKNHRLLISKNKKNITLYFIKDNNSLILTQNKIKQTYELFKEGKDYQHNVFYKLNSSNIRQVGYYSKSKMKYFKTVERGDDCTASHKPLLEQMGSKDIIQKIGELQITSLLDQPTCEKISATQKQIFKDALTAQFKTKSSSFVTCLTNPEVQKILEKDQFLQSNATAVLARFLSLVDKVSNGEKPLKIKCNLEPSEKMQIASYNEKTEPVEISINFKNNKFASTVKKTDIDGNEKADVKTILNHELFHYGAQQYPLGKNLNCLDERIVQLFDKICSTPDFSKATFQSSADILNQCSSNADVNKTTIANLQSDKVSTSLVNVETASPGAAAALSNLDDQNALAQQQQLAMNLTKTMGPEVFTPVAETDISILANSPLYNKSGVETSDNYGVQQAILKTPAVQKSLENVMAALDKATVGMASGLNKAIAITANLAQAASIKGNTDHSSQNALYPVSQIVAEKYSPDFNPKSLPAPTGSAPQLATSPTEASPQKNLNNDTSSNSDNSVVANNTRTPSPTNTGAAAPRKPASESVNGFAPAATLSGNTATRDPASTAPTQNTESTAREPSRALDNRVLQSLTAFNQMTGSQYAQVAQQYSDPAFINLLKKRGISIVIVNEKNRKVGAMTGALYSFIDNGKTLVKVEEGK